MAYKKADLDSSLLKYKPVYPQAPEDTRYHYRDNGVLKIKPETSTLIRSVEELREYAKTCKGVKVAVDTETTGLTYGKDFVVGFSVAKDMYHGIYVPIRHQIRRVDKIQEDKKDENGNILYTKAGKPRKMTVTKETFLENPLNLPAKECLDILYEIMLNASLVIMHNSEFDLTMIGQEGYDVMKCRTFDTTILTYLYDSENKGWNKLKEASKIVLGRKPMKFAEALGDEDNFRYVDLEVGAPYGSSDAINTYGLFVKLYPEVKKLIEKSPKTISMDSSGPYNVINRDNELIRAFTDYYNRVDLIVDNKAAKEYQKFEEESLIEIETKIYEYFKKGAFNLSTGSNEFKEIMNEFHIETGHKTDKGATSYGKEGIKEMDRALNSLKAILTRFKEVDYNEKSGSINKRHSLDELKLSTLMMTYGKEQFSMTESANTLNVRTIEGIKCTKKELFDELKLMYKRVKANMDILQLIQKRSSMVKALNSYIEKLTQVDKCHMRYRLQGTASGRLSSGNGSKSEKRKNHYFIDLNAQNLTKPHSAYYNAVRSDEEGNILGWKFEPVTEDFMKEHEKDENYYFVEGSDPKNNIRNCLIAPKGRYLASLDYSAQEYRAIAILSGDKVMINNFKRGLDPHTATAYGVWGEENYDRQKRKKAKIVNFCINYGGQAPTLAKNLEEPLEEAQKILANYEKTFWECCDWKKNEINKCIQRQGGVCYSIFGRPRQFKSRLTTAVDIMDVGRQGGKDGIPGKVFTKKGKGMMEAVNRRIVSHLVQGCLQGDTRILTNHGYIKIKELYDLVQQCKLDETWQVYTGDKWADFTVLSMGKARKAKLLLKGGITLNCDDRHEVFAHTNSSAHNSQAKIKKVTEFNNRKSQICVLRPEEFDFAPVLPSSWTSTPKTGNARVVTIMESDHEQLWYWVGYFMGDGYWLGHYSDYKDYYKRGMGYCFGRHEEEKANKCVEWFSKFGLNPRKKYCVNDKGGKTIHVIVHAAGYIEFMTDLLGIPVGCHFDTKRVPDILFRSPLAHRKAFIKGLMDSDGYYKEGRLHMKNYELLRDVKLLCTISGIHTRLNSPERRKCGTTNLTLGAPYAGLSDKGRCEIRTLGRDPRYGAASFHRLDIEDELVDTYTLSVFDDEHRFVSDDVISKNCCGDICRWDLIRLYRRFFKHRDPHIDFYSTVHDEINFSIDKEVLIDYVREIDDIMTIKNLHKDLPIVTSIDLGYTLGVLFPFEWKDETRTELIPKRC